MTDLKLAYRIQEFDLNELYKAEIKRRQEEGKVLTNLCNYSDLINEDEL